MSTDFERLRDRERDASIIRKRMDQIGSAAFLGKVVSTGTNLGTGKYVKVRRLFVMGTESEGGSGTVSESPSGDTIVYFMGPNPPLVNDEVICYREKNRWVAKKRKYYRIPIPCPGTTGGVTGAHKLCWHPLDQQANVHPAYTVTVTGPGGYSATPTITFTYSSSTNSWGASWNIRDLDPGDYTIVAAGLRYITNTRTITITVRCGAGKNFTHTPRSKHVWCFIQSVNFTLAPGVPGWSTFLVGATVTVSGWRSATTITAAGGPGAIGGGNLEFPDIQEPYPDAPDVVVASAGDHCTRTRCLVLSCQLSEFLYQRLSGFCPSYDVDNSLDPPCEELGDFEMDVMGFDEADPLSYDDDDLVNSD